MPGRLTIVGTGITLGVHVTREARAAIERADEVLYLVAEPAVGNWIERLNPNARSLEPLYGLGDDRREIYARLVEEVASCVRAGRRVCFALYGHPGVYAYPSHELLRLAREEGWAARMLPAVSAEDCLFADVGLDPGLVGCQSYEATDFLLHGRRVDPTAALVLWQVTVIGTGTAVADVSRPGLRLLAERLLAEYPPGHEVVIYEAATYPILEPTVLRVRLDALAEADVPPMATLCVPPAAAPAVDEEMARRLDSFSPSR